MNVTKDPRCPKHPHMGVWPGGGDVLQWYCSACSRPLGIASLSEWPSEYPHGAKRPVPPSHMTARARDYDWLFGQVLKRGVRETNR